MNTRELIEGLQILLPYYENQDGYHHSAEKDVLYIYPTDVPLVDADIKKMIALGWVQAVDSYAEDFAFGINWAKRWEVTATKHYDPNESWMCCT
jgi:hypothetical protein